MDAHKITRSKNITEHSKKNRYLTNDNEIIIVHITKLMGGMGIYIGKDTYLEIICAILLSRTDSVNYSETKIGIVDCILKNNETWIKLITCYTSQRHLV